MSTALTEPAQAESLDQALADFRAREKAIAKLAELYKGRTADTREGSLRAVEGPILQSPAAQQFVAGIEAEVDRLADRCAAFPETAPPHADVDGWDDPTRWTISEAT